MEIDQQRYPVSQLDWLLDDLVRRVPHLTRAVFLSQDGLALGASRGLDQADTEHLAALAAGFQSLARGASRHFGGDARQSIIEMTSGFFIVSAAGQGTCLAVLTTTEADIGQVAYEMAILVQRTGDHLQVNMRTRSALSDTLGTGAMPAKRRTMARRCGRSRSPAVCSDAGPHAALRRGLRPGRDGHRDPGPDRGPRRPRTGAHRRAAACPAARDGGGHRFRRRSAARRGPHPPRGPAGTRSCHDPGTGPDEGASG